MKSSPGWEASYLGQLRAAVGNRMLITPGASAVIQDDNGQILLIQRSDNLEWAIPGGSMELGYSVYDTLVREVREETGLEVISATLFAIYSEPRFVFTNAFGGEHQPVHFAFRVDKWKGSLITDTDESADARFFPPNHVPERYQEALSDLRDFVGTVILK
ncbi:MAG: NUDIX domain-containing protein [SAR202 cluster bacterium]|nr:NUDIX domain-containing protein [SAR202 cluster bacterium]